MSEKLLPCPFCGRELEHDADIEATHHPKIPYGEYCPLKGFLFASDRRDVIAKWNSRAATVTTQGGRNEKLREALRPFAEISQFVEFTDFRDGEIVHRQIDRNGNRHELTKDHFRAAAAALAEPAPTVSPQERWYLGSMNDGLFIINTPPRPSTDDVWHDRPDGPTLVIPMHSLSHQDAQAVCDAHNATLTRAERSGDGA